MCTDLLAISVTNSPYLNLFIAPNWEKNKKGYLKIGDIRDELTLLNGTLRSSLLLILNLGR